MILAYQPLTLPLRADPLSLTPVARLSHTAPIIIIIKCFYITLFLLSSQVTALTSQVILNDWHHFALRPQKRGGLLGTGTGWGGGGGGGGGTKEWRLDRGYHPKQTGETVDRRQNNGSVKAVSPCHCPATSALRNCCFNCCAWAEWQGQCPLHCCWGETRSERSPTFAAQLHLPTHDLFWANLKVQLHLPPLDLDLFIFWSRLEPCEWLTACSPPPPPLFFL